MTNPPIDTRTVTDRRTLRFATTDDLRGEIDRLTNAERAGTLRASGNWSLGQAFGHLAAWIDYAYDGYPPQARPPWFVKVICRMMKKKFFAGGLPAGVRIPRVEGGTFGIDPLPLDEGRDRLLRALDRLDRTPPPLPSPVFGRLTHDEWRRLNLGHAELHLSFFHPG
ncbi:MAG TPA: DUF1569 domain-containing protein [Phycisphaerales bacterium]|nr:DUF1569 domain-containing protein [Phycisphaerales bacterium]